MPTPCVLNPPGGPSFNEILITVVREHPSLYNNQRRTFDSIDRHQLWTEVATKIGRGVTPEFAKKRWLQLRDRYRKELKQAIANNFLQPQKWNHFHLLRWLDPFLQGAMPLKGADRSSPVFSVDGANGTSPSFYDEFTSRYCSSRAQSEGASESGISDAIEETKPLMSTLQTVLAAAEANANLHLTPVFETDEEASNAFETDGELDHRESTPQNNTSVMVDTANQDSAEHSSPVSHLAHCSAYDSIHTSTSGQDAHDALSARSSYTTSEASTSTASPIVSNSETIPQLQLNDGVTTVTSILQQSLTSVTSESYCCNSPNNVLYTSATEPVMSLNHHHHHHPYTNARNNYSNIRFRARNNRKQIFVPPSIVTQKLNPPRITSTPSPPLEIQYPMDWYNDEDMLFARMVGLRLKKLDLRRRRAARMNVMKILDSFEEDECRSQEGANGIY